MSFQETYTNMTPRAGRIVTVVKVDEPKAVYKVTSVMPGYIDSERHGPRLPLICGVRWIKKTAKWSGVAYILGDARGIESYHVSSDRK